MNNSSRWYWQGTLLLAGLAILFFIDISLGTVKIPLNEVFSILAGNESGSSASDIIMLFRLPKAVTCIVAGAALAASGLMMQTFFRNPLAGPDVLGLSAGASLMVAILLLAGQSLFFLSDLITNPWIIAAASALGSILVFFLIIMIAQHIRDNATLLVIGLMLSAATISIVSVLQFVSKAEDLQAFVIWTFGSVGNTSWKEITALSVVVVIGGLLAFSSIKSLNTWLLGENYALSLGIPIRRSRMIIVTATGLLVGSVTAFCGPIAFVGLAVPHLVRIVVPTSNHKILIPTVMVGGAMLLLFCDIVAQSPRGATIIPINAVTSLIGAPVVIWVIMRSKTIRM
jgi:iron complex transport system permease protein